LRLSFTGRDRGPAPDRVRDNILRIHRAREAPGIKPGHDPHFAGGHVTSRLTRLVLAAVAAVAAYSGDVVAQSAGGASPAPVGVMKLEIAPGTKAFFRVREQLVGINFPNDAVGMTEAVQGVVVIRPDGTLDASQSRITVDLRTLSTDQDRRDNYLRRNTLQTDQFPMAVFVPKRAVGLTWPPPIGTPPPPGPPTAQGGGGGPQAAGAGGGAQAPPAQRGQMGGGQAGGGQAGGGQAAGPRPGAPIGFQLVGDMTIRDVTTEVTWQVITSWVGDTVRGKAMTNFPFATFKLERPSVSVVMGVEDDIRLELELHMTRSSI
jgi:polyisoprenoid-binding protein YceI